MQIMNFICYRSKKIGAKVTRPLFAIFCYLIIRVWLILYLWEIQADFYMTVNYQPINYLLFHNCLYFL